MRGLIAAIIIAAFTAFSISPLAARDGADCIRTQTPTGFECVDRGAVGPANAAAKGRKQPDQRIYAMVTSAASSAGVPANIAHRVIRQESGYRPGVRGKAGEYGLGQIKCATAKAEGFGGNCDALFNPEINLKYSMSYLRKALDRGGVEYYNSGIHAKIVPHSARQYASAVMGR